MKNSLSWEIPKIYSYVAMSAGCWWFDLKA